MLAILVGKLAVVVIYAWDDLNTFQYQLFRVD